MTHTHFFVFCLFFVQYRFIKEQSTTVRAGTMQKQLGKKTSDEEIWYQNKNNRLFYANDMEKHKTIIYILFFIRLVDLSKTLSYMPQRFGKKKEKRIKKNLKN